MIKKLRRRFIRIAVVALTIAMVLVVGTVNLANWVSVRSELDDTIGFILENEYPTLRADVKDRQMGKNKHARNLVSESSWFSVYFDESGSQRMMDLENMTDADIQLASALAEQAISRGAASAFLQEYRYRIIVLPNGGKTVLFLNCETKLAAVRTLAYLSAAACLAGILLAWFFVTLASRKAVEPTIRNMEQQKQFITNASHELKTPLTVISTSMELLQMELPDNQWVRSTQKQTAQMRHLVDELVYLSRLEEENAPLTMEKLNLASLLLQTAEPFLAMAEYQGREMQLDIEDPLMMTGDRASIQRLISTLCDNAVKYAAGDSPICISAKSEGRGITLTVSNEVEQPLTREQCAQLFNRFYRMDASRSKERQNGFGIGLAIAAAVMEKHGGSISAAMHGEKQLAFTCLFPRNAWK